MTKRVLVVQGGSMRGVFASGALHAMQELGMGDYYDIVIGDSAGSLNGTFFAAGYADEAVDLFAYLAENGFINPLRLNKIVDIDVLINRLRDTKPDLAQRVKDSGVDLRFIVTDTSNGKPEVLPASSHQPTLIKTMHVSAAMPFLYGKEVDLAGRNFVDGGLSVGVPYQIAKDMGATEITVILTRPIDFKFKSEKSRLAQAVSLMGEKHSPAITDLLQDIRKIYNKSYEEIRKDLAEGKLNVTVIAPESQDELVGMTCRDSKELRRLGSHGYQQAMIALNGADWQQTLAKPQFVFA